MVEVAEEEVEVVRVVVVREMGMEEE